jgi:hypothetical protein
MTDAASSAMDAAPSAASVGSRLPLPFTEGLVQYLYPPEGACYSSHNPSLVMDFSPARGDLRPIQQGQCVEFSASRQQEIVLPAFTLAPSDEAWSIEYYLQKEAGIRTTVLGAEKGSRLIITHDGAVSVPCLRVETVTTRNQRTSLEFTAAGAASRGKIRLERKGNQLTLSYFPFEGQTIRETRPIASGMFAEPVSITRLMRSGASYGSGRLWGVRLYQFAILRRFYRLDEQAGTIAYDSSGYGQHGTLVNAPARARQAIISYQNEVGYSDGEGGVKLPRNEGRPEQDVLGNRLQYQGRCHYYALLKRSHCLYVQKGAEILIPALKGTEKISHQGNAALIVKAGKLVATRSGTLWDIKLSNGWRYPCAEGAGQVLHNVAPGLEESVRMMTHGVIIHNHLILTSERLGALSARRKEKQFLFSAGDVKALLPHAGGFMKVSGLANDALNRWYRIDAIASRSLTLAHGFIADLSGQKNYRLEVDLSWGQRQDVFHYNLKYGHTQVSGVRVPAVENGQIDARSLYPLTHPAGNFHNNAETRLDMTGGVASPLAVAQGWEADLHFKRGFFEDTRVEQASYRPPPRYYNHLHPLRERSFLTYARPLTQEENLALLEHYFSDLVDPAFRYGNKGRMQVVNLDAERLDKTGKTNMRDALQAIIDAAHNAGVKHLIFASSSPVTLRIGSDATVPGSDLPLLMRAGMAVTMGLGVRLLAKGSFNNNGAIQTDINPYSRTNYDAIELNNFWIRVVKNNSVQKQQAISLNNTTHIRCRGILIHGLETEGFAFTFEGGGGVIEALSINSGHQKGGDGLHLLPFVDGLTVRDFHLRSEDDAFSITVEAKRPNETIRNVTLMRGVCESRGHSGLKIMVAPDSDTAGTAIEGIHFKQVTFGAYYGGQLAKPHAAQIYRKQVTSLVRDAKASFRDITFSEVAMGSTFGYYDAVTFANLEGGISGSFKIHDFDNRAYVQLNASRLSLTLDTAFDNPDRTIPALWVDADGGQSRENRYSFYARRLRRTAIPVLFLAVENSRVETLFVSEIGGKVGMRIDNKSQKIQVLKPIRTPDVEGAVMDQGRGSVIGAVRLPVR